jgi:hypothetical protein
MSKIVLILLQRLINHYNGLYFYIKISATRELHYKIPSRCYNNSSSIIMAYLQHLRMQKKIVNHYFQIITMSHKVVTVQSDLMIFLVVMHLFVKHFDKYLHAPYIDQEQELYV